MDAEDPHYAADATGDHHSLPLFFYNPKPPQSEQWLIIHVRRLFIHTFHHDTLSVSKDGRVAVATGPYLTIFHPPPVTPFRPTLNPPLHRVYTDSATSNFRKDTLSTSTHITVIAWAQHDVLLLNGSNSLITIRSPSSNDDQSLSPDSPSRVWVPEPFSLPEQLQAATSVKNYKFRCLAHTRLRYSIPHTETGQVGFQPFLACGTNNSADLIPTHLTTRSSIQNSTLQFPHFRIHPVTTNAISCVEGIETSSGFATVIAIADASLKVHVYTIVLQLKGGKPSYLSNLVWRSSPSIPRSPITSLAWSHHSSRGSALTLAAAMGNNVVIVDWMKQFNVVGSEIWTHPQVHCIQDAHEKVVTSAQICQDGSVISSCMDGQIICWRLSPISQSSSKASSNFEIAASVLKERSDSYEPVLKLECSSNAFAVVSMNSKPRQGLEVCDLEVTRKSTGAQRRTAIRLYVVPPFGNPDQIEAAITSCADRLMTHPSHLDQPLTFWDVSHFLYSISAVSQVVVPRLRVHLSKMVEENEKGQEKSTQRFVHRCRVLFWFARIIDHPDWNDDTNRQVIKELSRRVRNSLLFVNYMRSVERFLKLSKDINECSEMERLALDQMCQFLSAWHVQGLVLSEFALQAVPKARRCLEPFMADGASLTSRCSVCECVGSGSVLVADGMDPSSLWCAAGHTWNRCMASALPIDEVISLECSACSSRARHLPEDEFKWISQHRECVLCKGGLVSGHCEAN